MLYVAHKTPLHPHPCSADWKRELDDEQRRAPRLQKSLVQRRVDRGVVAKKQEKKGLDRFRAVAFMKGDEHVLRFDFLLSRRREVL